MVNSRYQKWSNTYPQFQEKRRGNYCLNLSIFMTLWTSASTCRKSLSSAICNLSNNCLAFNTLLSSWNFIMKILEVQKFFIKVILVKACSLSFQFQFHFSLYLWELWILCALAKKRTMRHYVDSIFKFVEKNPKMTP